MRKEQRRRSVKMREEGARACGAPVEPGVAGLVLEEVAAAAQDVGLVDLRVGRLVKLRKLLCR